MQKNLWALVLIGAGALTASAAYAGEPAPSGKELVNSKGCVACHGENGRSTSPEYPALAGQHRDYLVEALNDYKKGERNNAIMAGMVAGLTKQDIATLARYFSTLPPALKTHR